MGCATSGVRSEGSLVGMEQQQSKHQRLGDREDAAAILESTSTDEGLDVTMDEGVALKESGQNATSKASSVPEEYKVVVKDVKPSALGYLSVALSETGYSPISTKVNQDACLVKPNFVPGISLYGVFDGHGELGHDVSYFVSNRLPVLLASQGDLLFSNPVVAIRNAVKLLQAQLRGSGIRTAYSGTTATFALLYSDKLFVANIGDSRAVLARSLKGGRWEAVALSQDHKPDLPGEKLRILTKGGRVETLKGPPGADCGPYRVWLAHAEAPGLAMSRSLGDDVAHTIGVIGDPEIAEYNLQDSDVALILATDGVWEFISSEEAVGMLAKESFSSEILLAEDSSLSAAAVEERLMLGARKLVKKSQKKWRKMEQVIDDISTVIVDLRKSKVSA